MRKILGKEMVEFGIIRAAGRRKNTIQTRKKKKRNERQARDKYLFISIILSFENNKGVNNDSLCTFPFFFLLPLYKNGGRE